ncbi:uncharacterized protein [Typha latifolia]|uniref:uncharacterized protein n=1 Tax=Typha latifolia TaxID=4733 RepID=UPI003C2F2003
MVVAPVVNMRRERMLKHRQAAWLLYHIGIDASALLFADEVDLEGLIMTRQLSIVVVGQDILKTNGEVHSQCTFLTDNYCEESYNLLQSPNIKKLLLAGILSDTQNLNTTGKSSTNRDSEAVQLLLVGSTPNKRHELFRQLMQDHKEHSFLESLKTVYGKPSNDDNDERRMSHDHTPPRRNSTSVSHQDEFTPNSANQKPAPPASAQVVPEAGSRGKNKFFLAKWFGFGSK